MKVSKINATKRFKKITKNVKKQPPELFYKIRCSLKFRFFIEHLQATASRCQIFGPDTPIDVNDLSDKQIIKNHSDSWRIHTTSVDTI